MPDFLIETKLLQNNPEGLVCGIDEVGRGWLAGPVMACALVLKPSASFLFPDINDSKKLVKKKREAIALELKKHSFFGLGLSSVEEIDEINILQASFLAMQRAFNDLLTKCVPCAVLVDGNKAPDLSVKAYPVIGGDAKCLSIAAASIVAKVMRDELMVDLAKADNNEVYMWQVNAGYGTKVHREALQKFGISKHHRKTFAPVKNMIS